MPPRIARLIVTGLLVSVPFAAAHAYPKPSFRNWAPFPVKVTVHYAVCETVSFTVPAATDDKKGGTNNGFANGGSENICTLTKITAAPVGAPTTAVVETYISPGTHYRAFVIAPYTTDGKDWYIVATVNFPNPKQGTAGMSPGFAITNKTQWPVAVALDQLGCLYHDVIQPGQSMNRTTGAVWFTVWAQIVPDSKDPNSDLACAAPIVSATTAVLMGFATGGAAAWAGLTAAATTESVGSTFALLVPSTAVKSGASAIATQMATATAQGLLKSLTEHQWTQKLGQYAGPPWPFRCAQKPQYDINGGWGTTKVDAAGNLTIDAGSPLTLSKTNSCGNNMMK